MLSWINQDSVIRGSKHFFHPAEEDLPKSVLPGAPLRSNLKMHETLTIVQWKKFQKKFASPSYGRWALKRLTSSLTIFLNFQICFVAPHGSRDVYFMVTDQFLDVQNKILKKRGLKISKIPPLDFNEILSESVSLEAKKIDHVIWFPTLYQKR